MLAHRGSCFCEAIERKIPRESDSVYLAFLKGATPLGIRGGSAHGAKAQILNHLLIEVGRLARLALAPDRAELAPCPALQLQARRCLGGAQASVEGAVNLVLGALGVGVRPAHQVGV